MKYNVIINTELRDRPEDHELAAAFILAAHFRTDVIFLRPESRKTPDLEIRAINWEIKSPRGNGKKTIDNNLRAARKQSQNIVLDLRRIKQHQLKAISRINYFLSAGPHNFKRILVISKTGKIIELL